MSKVCVSKKRRVVHRIQKDGMSVMSSTTTSSSVTVEGDGDVFDMMKMMKSLMSLLPVCIITQSAGKPIISVWFD